MTLNVVIDNRANRGVSFENIVFNVFKAARDRGLPVQVFPQTNKWIPLKNGKRGAFPVRGAPVDLLCTIAGKSVAFECKSITHGDKLSFHESKFGTNEIIALAEQELAFGYSYVLAEFKELEAIGIMPFRPLYDAWMLYQTRRRRISKRSKWQGYATLTTIGEWGRIIKLSSVFMIPEIILEMLDGIERITQEERAGLAEAVGRIKVGIF